LKLSVRFDSGFTQAEFIKANVSMAILLVNAESVEFISAKPQGALALAGKGFEVYVFAKEAVDTAALAARFKKEADKERQFAERMGAKLSNESFINSAPAEIVAAERAKLEEARTRVSKLDSYLVDLGDA